MRFLCVGLVLVGLTGVAKGQTPTPTPLPTPHATFPIIRCGPPTMGDTSVTCCFVWKSGFYWLPQPEPGFWVPLGCSK